MGIEDPFGYGIQGTIESCGYEGLSLGVGELHESSSSTAPSGVTP